MENDITQEQISQHYSAMLDSVGVIDAALADPEKYADDETLISRNVGHLSTMITRDFWTTEDMDPIITALARASQ
jgi:hypothetical protein